jgi:hypothetical protein
MKWLRAFGWLAIIAAGAASAAAQDNVGAAAEAVTITAAPRGGVRMAVVRKATYLSVATSPAPEALADQLKLPKGVGLLVDFVDAKSPAAAAGLRKNDVLMKLDDQLLVNPAQLLVLVRMRKPKDKVALTLVRETEEQKVAAELGESEEAMGEIRADCIEWQPDGRVTLAQNLANMNSARRAATASTSSFSDGEHTLTLTATDGQKHLMVKDRAGNLVFNGPVNAPAQRKEVPPDILKKLENLEATVQERSRGTVSLIEDGLTVTLTTDAGQQTVVAKDADGKALFEGPVGTEDQRAKMPAQVRAKVEKLWKTCAAVWQSSQENP